MTLKAEVAAWDGKTAADITHIYESHKGDPRLGTRLVAALGDPSCERGITWLIKHHLEQGWDGATPKQAGAIIGALEKAAHWETRLHILQCLDHLEIPEETTTSLAACLTDTVGDDAKFVRAWAYHGWYRLADQHPSFSIQARTVLEQANGSETAASARVKIRNALKKLGNG